MQRIAETPPSPTLISAIWQGCAAQPGRASAVMMGLAVYAGLLADHLDVVAERCTNTR